MEITASNLPLLYLGISAWGAYFLYAFLVYPLLFHPLRKIPCAHWSVRLPYVGSLWILYQRYSANGNAATLAAHQKHGEVVRLGYEELAVNCVTNGIRTVYGGGWEKTDWYARRNVIYGVFNMFATMRHTPHSQKKRTVANVYSKSNLQTSPQLKENSAFLYATRFLPLLQSASESGEVIDVFSMNNAFSMDSISAYVYGITRSTNVAQDLQARREVIRNCDMRNSSEWFLGEIPPGVRRWMNILRLSSQPRAIAKANQELEIWNSAMCDSAETYLRQNAGEKTSDQIGDEPVVYRYFKTGMEKLRLKDPEAGREFIPHVADPSQFLASSEGLELMSERELHCEMLDHVEAGFSTSGVALTYLNWELSRNPAMQSRLNQELLTLEPSIVWPLPTNAQSLELPDPKAIDSLPYLHAVFMETLRVHTPIPGREPRVSPFVAGGSTLGTFTGIPGGITVSAMPYGLHRNADVFPEPDVFDPDRWLTTDEEKLKEMYRWFWAFGSGGRMCVGSHFAVQAIKLLVAAVYSNWKTEIVDDEGIETLDGYGAAPRSDRLMLRFVHR